MEHIGRVEAEQAQREFVTDRATGRGHNISRGLLGGKFASTKPTIDAVSKSSAQLSGNLDKVGMSATKAAGNKTSGMMFLEDMSQENVKRFREVSSAMQGFMLGLAAANRDVMGLAFSLIFLQFAGFGKLALAMATITFGATIAFRKIKEILDEAKELEKIKDTLFNITGSSLSFKTAQATGERIVDELNIRKQIEDEFIKALTNAQLLFRQEGIEFDMSDITLASAIFAQAMFDADGNVEEATNSMLESLRLWKEDGVIEINGVRYSLEQLMRVLAGFSGVGTLEAPELLDIFDKVEQAVKDAGSYIPFGNWEKFRDILTELSTNADLSQLNLDEVMNPEDLEELNTLLENLFNLHGFKDSPLADLFTNLVALNIAEEIQKLNEAASDDSAPKWIEDLTQAIKDLTTITGTALSSIFDIPDIDTATLEQLRNTFLELGEGGKLGQLNDLLYRFAVGLVDENGDEITPDTIQQYLVDTLQISPEEAESLFPDDIRISRGIALKFLWKSLGGGDESSGLEFEEFKAKLDSEWIENNNQLELGLKQALGTPLTITKHVTQRVVITTIYERRGAPDDPGPGGIRGGSLSGVLSKIDEGIEYTIT